MYPACAMSRTYSVPPNHARERNVVKNSRFNDVVCIVMGCVFFFVYMYMHIRLQASLKADISSFKLEMKKEIRLKSDQLISDIVLFDSNIIKDVLRPTTLVLSRLSHVPKEIQTITAPCIQYRNHNYILGPRHTRFDGSLEHPFADVALLSPSVVFKSSIKTINVLLLEESDIKQPSLGDQLLSFGFYGVEPCYWSGRMIYEATVPGCRIDNEVSDSCPLNETVKMFATDGIQFPGMSGALVINNCGVIGIAVQHAVQQLIGSQYPNKTYIGAGAQVLGMKPILYLLKHKDAAQYRVLPSQVENVMKLPKKSFCKLGSSARFKKEEK